MYNRKNKKYPTQLIISSVILFFGLLLLSLNIVIEDEPGAIPLIVVLFGLVYFLRTLKHYKQVENITLE